MFKDFNETHFGKDSPGVGDVHVATAMGNSGKRKKKPITTVGSGATLHPVEAALQKAGHDASSVDVAQVIRLMEHAGTQDDGVLQQLAERLVELAAVHEPIDEGASNAVMKLAEPGAERALVPFARARLARNPLPVVRHALAQIRPDQMPRFLGALTHPEELDKRKMDMSELTAIQDRVDPRKVEAIRAGAYGKMGRPVVVRLAERNYVLDGNHRLAARWLDGKDKVKVRFLDLSQADTIKSAVPWTATVKISKLDDEKQQVFGWASVSTINGELVVDKQQDIVEPHELEIAAYDFVRHSRTMGHMHQEKGVGELIESIMFTKQKQEVLGIDLGLEGWWTGWQVTSKKVWESIKGGELPELSIGGLAVPVEVD